MAQNFTGYLPQYYPQYAPPVIPQVQRQSAGFSLIPVKDESEVNSYPVGIGQTVFLIDFDKHILYIKSVDQSGMPQPIRIFDERIQSKKEEKVDFENYISRDEFNKFKTEMRDEIRRRSSVIKENKNVQS